METAVKYFAWDIINLQARAGAFYLPCIIFNATKQTDAAVVICVICAVVWVNCAVICAYFRFVSISHTFCMYPGKFPKHTNQSLNQQLNIILEMYTCFYQNTKCIFLRFLYHQDINKCRSFTLFCSEKATLSFKNLPEAKMIYR